MVSKHIQYVHRHPPRCIAGLNPKPTARFRPTLRLPRHRTVYHGMPGDEADTVSFVIGCPCGNRAVFLLGYHVRDERRRNIGFVGPLGVECPNCETVSGFFDTRNHGHDGEQGVNTYIVGEGAPDRFACPNCGATALIVCASFAYTVPQHLKGEMLERRQDYFEGLDIVGQCTQCNALVEVTSFECA